MKIDRRMLLEKLTSFARSGNGVIVGVPGSGKSYLLRQFAESLRSRNETYLYMPVDQLGSGSEEDLRRELGYSGDFIQELDKISSKRSKTGTVILDGFDAARSTEARRNFLKIVKRIVHQLKGKWSIIVSVRVYDAARSQDLLSLFGNVESGSESRNEISDGCRTFEIPELDDNELKEAIAQIPNLARVIDLNNRSLMKILRNPFSLHLIEKVTESKGNVSGISGVSSEVQLLEIYWKHFVSEHPDSETRESLLISLTKGMMNRLTLSVGKAEIFDPAHASAWRALLSDGVLVEVSKSGQRVAFVHNILFDYALSILIIPEEKRELISFLSHDSARPFFLRPSLLYFFTRIWYSQCALFWDIFLSLLQEQDPSLFLTAQLVPTQVIACESRSLQDVENLFVERIRRPRLFSEAVLRIFQGRRVSRADICAFWIDFTSIVADSPDRKFVWEVASLVLEALNGKSLKDRTIVEEKCGSIGRKLLTWAWNERVSNPSEGLDGFSSSMLIPIVAKTFCSAPRESKALLEPCLLLVEKKEFPIQLIYRLSESISYIWKCDPQLVEAIYLTVFGHHEVSTEKTAFGTPIMPFLSNRRQDFEMCRFLLAREFAGFLNDCPIQAILCAVDILNTHVISRHLSKENWETGNKGIVEETFSFRGRSSLFVEDFSMIWAASRHSDYAIEIADDLFSYIEKTRNTTLLGEILDTFRDRAKVAFLWKRLLASCSRSADISELAIDLAFAEVFRSSGSTLYEYCLFVRAVHSKSDHDGKQKIERAILQWMRCDSDSERFENRSEISCRILGAIGKGELAAPEAVAELARLVQDVGTRENRPLVSFECRSESFTEQDWLSEQGVDVEDSDISKLRDAWAILDRFSTDWMNKVPPIESIKKVLPQMRSLQNMLSEYESKSTPNRVIIITAWTKLAASAKLVIRSSEIYESPTLSFVREILFRAASLPDETCREDDSFESPAWSPSPRTEAAEGLPLLLRHLEDDELFEKIRSLSEDMNPAVRYLVASELFRMWTSENTRFWNLLGNRVRKEKNRVVGTALIGSLARVIGQDEKSGVDILDFVVKDWSIVGKSPFSFDSVVPLIVWLELFRKNQWACDVFRSFLADVGSNSEKISASVAELLNWTRPRSLRISAERNALEGAVTLLREIFSNFGRIFDTSNLQSEEFGRVASCFCGVANEVVMRFRFCMKDDWRGEEEGVAPLVLRREFFTKIQPVLKDVLATCKKSTVSLMSAQTAHYFMELLRSAHAEEAAGVLRMAREVVEVSKSSGYALDSMATREAVCLVETILADHREILHNRGSLDDLLVLLNAFAEVGWPEALKALWRLDEAFR